MITTTRAAGTPSSHALQTLALASVRAGLLVAGTVHVAVALSHSTTSFGLFALGAGMVQLALGTLAFVRPSRSMFWTAAVSSLVLAQLYLLNVTVGLPPLIAHTHVSGTHTLLGLTLSQPNAPDFEGVLTLVAELAVFVGVCARSEQTASR